MNIAGPVWASGPRPMKSEPIGAVLPFHSTCTWFRVASTRTCTSAIYMQSVALCTPVCTDRECEERWDEQQAAVYTLLHCLAHCVPQEVHQGHLSKRCSNRDAHTVDNVLHTILHQRRPKTLETHTPTKSPKPNRHTDFVKADPLDRSAT